jgi:hypothetical protein
MPYSTKNLAWAKHSSLFAAASVRSQKVLSMEQCHKIFYIRNLWIVGMFLGREYLLKGRLNTVDLLINVACLVTKGNYILV